MSRFGRPAPMNKPHARGHARRLLPQLARFLRDRKPELLLFLVGVLLRLSMRWSYDETQSYDSQAHWDVVEWILRHHRIPTPDDVFQAQHPPLYYLIVAGLVSRGAKRAQIAVLSIACGTIRMALLWAGFELYMPRSRAARLAALALSAVLAASVHIDGMIYPEAMNDLLLTAAMLLVPSVFRSERWSRVRVAGALGIVLGLALLIKISAVVVILAIGAIAALELLLMRDDRKGLRWRLLSWVAMLVACVAVSGWYFARNVRDYDRPFVTSFDLKSQHSAVAAQQKVPYLERRALGFFVGWDKAVMLFPYFPSGAGTYPRFFPVAVASTFMDYWNYSFSGIDPSTVVPGWPGGQLRPITPKVFRASQYAVWGGTLIFFATVCAWLVAAPRVYRSREWGLLALLAIPLFTLLAALHFAIKYPVDNYGVVKGVYMQFGAPPMYALFGLAVAWTAQKRNRWLLFAALMAALWLVASYSFYCRLRWQIVPLS
jgi:4-amino-4-deoxy-L-arabinose transferase-like glycosyltransferase